MGQNLTVAVGDILFCGQHPLRVMAIKDRKVRLHSLTPGVHLTLPKSVVRVDITQAGVKQTLTLPLEGE